MSTTRHYIDYNQLYGLTLDYDPATQQLKVTVENDNEPWPRLFKAFVSKINVSVNGNEISPTRRANPLTFKPVTREFTLSMGKEPIGKYTVNQNGSLSQTFQRPLIVDETRRMGTFHDAEPYPERREGMTYEENEALLRTAKNAIVTDFHTHSSGQITPQGLLDVAMKQKPYYYPIELLDLAGINIDYDHIASKHRAMIPRIPFTPKDAPGTDYSIPIEGADLHALTDDDLRKLAAHMALPPDKQSTFTEMEHEGYRFRYPLTKDNSLIRGTLIKMAQEYAAQGIRHASISFVGLDDPKKLKIVHDTIEEMKHDPSTASVDLRFMMGIPRGFPLPKIAELLEKAKILLDSPYFIGVDFLGYEVNKTADFVHLFDDFAKWANEHKPGACLRVHAGENDKNIDNVKDFLKMAEKYPNLKYLVGHGLYGIDESTTKLAAKLSDPENPRLFMEFNPASNIALNNIDDVRKVPFRFALEQEIPFIVSSDSAGTYLTSSVQLGLSAYYAGLDAKGFDTLTHHQEYLRAHQIAYSDRIASQVPEWNTSHGKADFLHQIEDRLKEVPAAIIPPVAKTDKAVMEQKLKDDQVLLIKQDAPTAALKDKFPITIVGASGESWKRIPKGQQRENAIAVDMLIHAVNENCYLYQGRNKKLGLSKVINQARQDVDETRAKKKQPPMPNVGVMVTPNFDDSHSYKHLTHMEYIEGGPLDVADAIVKHTFDHEGVIVAVDGAAYTRDIILKADQRGIHDNAPGNKKMLLLLANTPGASADKAQVLHPDYGVQDGKQLIKKLYSQRPDLFPRSFSLKNLNDLYEEASARVTTYGYNIADMSVVTGPKTIVKTYRQEHQPYVQKLDTEKKNEANDKDGPTR